MANHLLSLVATIAFPMVALAEPAPVVAAAPDAKGACARELTCVAEKFADTLSLPVAAPALRFDSLVTFESGRTRVYSQSREAVRAFASSWRKHARWSTITVKGYAGELGNLNLARQRANRIRGYLIRYGISAEYVVANGYDEPAVDPVVPAGAGRVDLTVDLCDRASRRCPRKQ